MSYFYNLFEFGKNLKIPPSFSSENSLHFQLWPILFGESYLVEQFRQITHYLAEQFRQIAHYLAENLIQKYDILIQWKVIEFMNAGMQMFR